MALSKKLSEIKSIWETSHKTLDQLQKEFKLKNSEVSKLREEIRNSNSLNKRIDFVRGE